MCRDDTISVLRCRVEHDGVRVVQSFTSPKLVYMKTGTANAGQRADVRVGWVRLRMEVVGEVPFVDDLARAGSNSTTTSEMS